MRKEHFLDGTFAHTTINLTYVQTYLRSDPGYLASSIDCEDDAFNQAIANHADYFEFHFKRYLAGRPKTLHRVFLEVRAFVAFDEVQARAVIPVLMENSVRQTLLEKEWYEWLPRYERARQRIEQRFGLLIPQEN